MCESTEVLKPLSFDTIVYRVFSQLRIICFVTWPPFLYMYSMPICLVADDHNSTEIAVTVSIHKILFKTL